MTNICTTTRRSEQGFTLVELAIVMVIIGLLIGGVLKGQELIGNARITATVAQMRSVDAALNGFQDKYNALPGDIANPAGRLPNCVAGSACAAIAPSGAGSDGVIGQTTANEVPALNNEVGGAFIHLAAADFLSGIDTRAAAQGFGTSLPSIKTGSGGFFIAYRGAAPVTITGTQLPNRRHYLFVSATPAYPTATDGPLTGVQAFQIDSKLDDGAPQSGTMQAMGPNNPTTGCWSGNAGAQIYNTTGAGNCALLARVLN